MPQYFSKNTTPIEIVSPFNNTFECPTKAHTHVLQATTPYVVTSRNLTAQTRGSGTIAALTGSSATALTTGTTTGSLALLTSQRYLHAAPGCTHIAKMCGAFSPGTPGTTQLLGYGLTGEGFFFGYSGNVFGLLLRRGGCPQVVVVTITAGGGLLAGKLTITLNGVATSITVGMTATIATIVATIMGTSFAASGTGNGWILDQWGSSIAFTATTAGARTGTYSVASTTTTAAATLTTSLTGVTPTDVWVPQPMWNLDPCDGSNDTSFSLNPTAMNIYQVSMESLNVGNVTFWVADSTTGHYLPVHSVNLAQYALNTQEALPLLAYIDNTSYAANLQLTFAAGNGERYGDTTMAAYPRFASFTAVSPTLTAGVVTNLLSVKNGEVFGSDLNKTIVRMIALTVSLSTQTVTGGTAATTIPAASTYMPVVRNSQFTNVPANLWTYTTVDPESACLQTKANTFSLTGGQLVLVASPGTNGGSTIDLAPYDIVLQPMDELNIGISSTGAPVVTVVVGLTWVEVI